MCVRSRSTLKIFLCMQWLGENYDDVNTIAIGPDHDNLRSHYLGIANHLGYTCTGEDCHPNDQNNYHSVCYVPNYFLTNLN